jgi:hypothetical protein
VSGRAKVRFTLLLSRFRLFDKLPRLISIARDAERRVSSRSKMGLAIATTSGIDMALR